MALNVNILTLLVLSFVSVVLVVTAETQNCMQVLNDRCTMPYRRTVDAVDPRNNQEMCTALAIYLRCVEDVKNTVKSCNSNLYYHTISTLIPRLMKDRNCGNISLSTNETALRSTKSPATPATKRPGCLNFTFEHLKPSKEQIRQNPHHFRLCALFGDPHLKTFTEERQTCVVQGAWPLIDNEYFSVQVTNVPLVAGSLATATNTVRSINYFEFAHIFTRNVSKQHRLLNYAYTSCSLGLPYNSNMDSNCLSETRHVFGAVFVDFTSCVFPDEPAECCGDVGFTRKHSIHLTVHYSNHLLHSSNSFAFVMKLITYHHAICF